MFLLIKRKTSSAYGSLVEAFRLLLAGRPTRGVDTPARLMRTNTFSFGMYTLKDDALKQ